MKCRNCQTPLEHVFLDLGTAPPSNAYLLPEALRTPEVYYPLRVFVCHGCWLVQTEDFAGRETFFSEDYAYFSATSRSWLDHAARFCGHVTDRFGLGPDSFVVEVASNDGYLLRNFVAADIPCLGIEPTRSTAEAATAIGVPTRQVFFGEDLGQQMQAQGEAADLIIGNNVYAHVPDICDFTRGLAASLKPEGVVSLEFPHLMQLIRGDQFDTVYHEHFSYLSLGVVSDIFQAAGLRVFDVQELPTHGGSLRVFGCLSGASHITANAVTEVLQAEQTFGLTRAETYQGFTARAEAIKNGLLTFLIEQAQAGKKVAGYGAAAKGNTLLNFAGVRSDLLPFVCDASPGKQGKYLPGSRIPILPPEALEQERPDTILILPWNIADEIKAQLSHLDAGFVAAIPEIRRL
jgi:hypothetical protein